MTKLSYIRVAELGFAGVALPWKLGLGFGVWDLGGVESGGCTTEMGLTCGIELAVRGVGEKPKKATDLKR